MDPVSQLEESLGAELLRARMLGDPRPRLGDRYVVESFLGRGATGLVVSALDERLGRPVALKLRPTGADSAMLSEARALARLDHPNVVRVHDVDIIEARFDGRSFRLWLVSMQRVPGRTLRAWLAERARTHEEIVDVFLDAARGLHAAHSALVVHRDFKPDNVVVRDDGVAQVIDFGFAIDASRESEARGAAGTEAYMAPEAKRGRANARSDQYAFAVSLMEALTGVARRPGWWRPARVPKSTWMVLRRATKDEDERFEDMAAMVAALSPGRRRSWWRWALVLALFTVAGGTMALGVLSASYDWTPTPPAPTSAPPAVVCPALPEHWSFETLVTHGSSDVRADSRGRYDLVLEPRPGCRFDLALVRVTDARPGRPFRRRAVPVAGRAAGVLVPGAQFGSLDAEGAVGGCPYTFHLRFREQDLEGSFEGRCDGTYSGTLRGTVVR